MKEKKLSTNTTIILITILSLISKLFGFVREIIFAYFFGTNKVGDSYLIAVGLPAILFGWVSTVALAYTPIYLGIRKSDSIEQSRKYTSNLINITFLVAACCTLLSVVFAEQLVKLAAPGFDAEMMALTSKFLKATSFVILFIGVIQIIISYYNCNNRFIFAHATNLVVSITQIIFIAISGIWNNYVMAVGYVVAYAAQFLLLIWFARADKILKKNKVYFDGNVKQTAVMLVPIFVSSMTNQINTLIDRTFASKLKEGSISALNYGTLLRDFVYVLFSTAITTIIYPMISKAVTENDINKVRYYFAKSINSIIVIFIPLTFGVMFLSKEVVILAFQRGKFDEASAEMTSIAFFMYSIGLMSIVIKDTCTRFFYSLKDTKPTLHIGFITVAFNILLNYLLVDKLEHVGLALATSVSTIIVIPIFFYLLKKKIQHLGIRHIFSVFLRTGIACAVMCGAMYLSAKYLFSDMTHNKIQIMIYLLTEFIVGVCAYTVSMFILKVDEFKLFTDMGLSIFKKVFKMDRR